MKEDVRISKPKKHVDKVGIVLTQDVNVGPKIVKFFGPTLTSCAI